MVRAIPDILAQIAEHKRKELAGSLPNRSTLERAAEASIATRRNFRLALETHDTAIIAEIKQASPSKGILTPDFRPADIARQYESGGAAALSVLTDQKYFRGDLTDLQSARCATKLPVLRKDFTIDEFHVVEAAAYGADAILLIAALLEETQLLNFSKLSRNYGMGAIVEVHDDVDLDRALASGAEIIGVNNRNLHTFEVTLEVAFHLAARIPAQTLKIAESGIGSRTEIQLLTEAGYRGFLIGEHLMKAGDPAQALRELTGCS